MKNPVNVSESIWSNKDVLIPMADVQHIEKLKDNEGNFTGISIITKHTKWDNDHAYWANSIYVSNFKKDAEQFIQDYCYFRYEMDIKPYENLNIK